MVYVFLANGFEEMEALCTVDILRRAGLSVTTVGVGGTQVVGTHNITVQADIAETAVNLQEIEAVILPGGMPGAVHLEQSQTVQAFLDRAVEENAYIGAICAAPFILGHRGLLQGKQAVCFPGFEEELQGAQVMTDAVVTDGHIVTAKGAGVVFEFALALVSVLVSEEKARQLREVMQCR